ncbi:hypothetical protein [Lysobacter capsici]|uniref:hypothetical protein n=1 Tax=Lysobacter capsici TaxID=435897 RepID=UPI001C00403F|nr:hypothetical protein [Lysobacter capsici]QWF14960.1 hypothetical protein KME82_14190 [Lysobacter capsici]
MFRGDAGSVATIAGFIGKCLVANEAVRRVLYATGRHRPRARIARAVRRHSRAQLCADSTGTGMITPFRRSLRGSRAEGRSGQAGDTGAYLSAQTWENEGNSAAIACPPRRGDDRRHVPATPPAPPDQFTWQAKLKVAL